MKFSYSIEEAFANLRYGGLINLLSLAIIALTVMILSALILVVIHIHGELKRLEDEPSIVAFLEDSVDKSSADQLRSQLEKIKDIESVTYISKQDALNRAREIFGEEGNAITEGLRDINPLPASLEIRTRTTDPKFIEKIAEEIRTYQDIEDVNYERGSAAFIWKAELVVIGLSVFLGSASIAIVCFSIMLTVYFRREELRVMRMVGATYWFIRVPLLLTGGILGLVGSALGLLALYGLFRIFAAPLGPIHFLPLIWVVRILGIGCLLGLIGGAIPVSKYLNA